MRSGNSSFHAGVAILLLNAGQAYKAQKPCSSRTGLVSPPGDGREPGVFPEDPVPNIREVKAYGRGCCIFASGFIMEPGVAALEQLKEEGINVY